MRAAEVGGRIVLTLLDDRTTNGAGAREMVEQLVARADADCALQRGQVLGEALQHLQHRLAVGQEHVAPHRRVAGGDAGEITKATGRVFDDLALCHRLQIAGGADDGVGDQVRQMTGDKPVLPIPSIALIAVAER